MMSKRAFIIFMSLLALAACFGVYLSIINNHSVVEMVERLIRFLPALILFIYLRSRTKQIEELNK